MGGTGSKSDATPAGPAADQGTRAARRENPAGPRGPAVPETVVAPAIAHTSVQRVADPFAAGPAPAPQQTTYVRSLESFGNGRGPYGAHAAHALMGSA